MKDSNLDRLKACIDQTVSAWNRTKLTEIEKYSREQMIIWGIFDAALFVLSSNDYEKLKEYTKENYGFVARVVFTDVK